MAILEGESGLGWVLLGVLLAVRSLLSPAGSGIESRHASGNCASRLGLYRFLSYLGYGFALSLNQ